MGFDYAVCAVAGAIVLAYLLTAMIRPERF